MAEISGVPTADIDNVDGFFTTQGGGGTATTTPTFTLDANVYFNNEVVTFVPVFLTFLVLAAPIGRAAGKADYPGFSLSVGSGQSLDGRLLATKDDRTIAV